MAKRSEKETTIAEIAEKFGRAEALALADYRGLNVAQMTGLRRKARENRVELRVVKNTLAVLAAEKAGIGAVTPLLKGPTAVAIGYEDPTAPAKLFVEFARTARQLELKGGYIGGQMLSAQDVRALAVLPSRHVLLGQVLGAIMGPLSNMASVLAAPMRGLIAATEDLMRKRESAAD